MAKHCSVCIETERSCPMPTLDAVTFGLAHTKAVLDQSIRGANRTAPIWLLPGALLSGGFLRMRRATDRKPLRMVLVTVAMAAGLQSLWIAGFAGVSGARTTIRLSRLSTQNMIPIEISCPENGPHVFACAHYALLRDSWYVDGVFAWPRYRGGGAAVIRRLLGRADAAQQPLTLTALSPTVAGQYRKIGFRYKLWIYLMRREPGQPSADPSPTH